MHKRLGLATWPNIARFTVQKLAQQIGYIEDDKAFDLFGRPCAIYNMRHRSSARS